MNWSFVTYFFKYFEHVKCFAHVSGPDNNTSSIFICWNTNLNILVFVIFSVFDFWLMILSIVFSSIFIVTTFANISILHVIIFIYFYVTTFTNSIHLINRTIHINQNRTEQNRTAQIRTEQNRTEQLITSYNRT